MSVKEGIYTFKFIPKNVHPPIFGGVYATAVEKDASIIGALLEFFARQNWHVVPVANKTNTYVIAFVNPLPEQLYMSTKVNAAIDNEAIILSSTPKEWNIISSSLPGGGYVISAVTPVIGVTFCIGLSEHDELILKSFPIVPLALQNRPRWEFDLQSSILPISPGIVLPTPTLSEWVSQKVTEIYKAESAGQVTEIINSFLAPKAKITYNSVTITQEQYTKNLRSGVPLEVAAAAHILDTVEVPSNTEKPKDAGTVGVFYHATLNSGLFFFGAPGEYLSTSSLDVVVKRADVDSIDPRRVFELTQVTSTKLLNRLPIPPANK